MAGRLVSHSDEYLEYEHEKDSMCEMQMEFQGIMPKGLADEELKNGSRIRCRS